MSNYHCKRFCGQTSDFICSNCLLKEIPAQRMIEELIRRKLVMVQKDSHTHKIQGYYLWRVDVENEKKGEWWINQIKPLRKYSQK